MCVYRVEGSNLAVVLPVALVHRAVRPHVLAFPGLGFSV